MADHQTVTDTLTKSTADSPINNLLIHVLKLCAAAGLLYWLISTGKIDFQLLFARSGNAVPEYIVAFVLLCIGWFIQIYRWKRLGDSGGIAFSYSEACKMTWASQFCSLVLPGAVGGELVRGYYIADRAPSRRITAVSTVIFDRGLGLYASLWLGMLSSIYFAWLSERFFKPVAIIGCFSGLMIVAMHLAWYMIRNRNILSGIKKVFPTGVVKKIGGIQNVVEISSRDMFLGAILSVVSSIFTILAFFTIGKTLSPGAGWLTFFMVCPLVFLSLALPVAPGGIGVGEASAAILFTMFNIHNGATMMLTFRMMNIILRLPGALFFVMIKRKQ